MRKNLASVIILGATAALSLSVVSPALAATYPPVVKVEFHSTGLDLGTPVGKVKKVAEQSKTTTKLGETVALNTPVDFTLKGFKPNTTVTPTAKGPNGKPITLPKLVVKKDGTLDTKALVFKVKGTYVITYKGVGGVTKTITIKVP